MDMNLLSLKDNKVLTYLDKAGIKRRQKGYRLLHKAILVFMDNSSLGCSEICNKVSEELNLSLNERTIYTTTVYAIKHSSNSETRAKSMYQFINDAGYDIQREFLNM